ncbi:MAG TPA: type I restriction endonuclease subunit R [Cyanobacteria bacterium UBA8803]|nr:type I restriction endonuclease subunit R [Cyanobacteria bacterium UBA9273]HBL57437.1 type I restriction endonuclease subunit R [Cyanobacteria bacterium UBA8803]
MVETVAVTRAITNLNEAHEKFRLTQTNDPQFFNEWYEDLPNITEAEKASLERLKNRYLYYIADGAISEGTVNIIMLSPLQELLGLCDPPYKIRGEKYVQIEIDQGETILQGRINALVVQNLLWVVLIESKQYGFSVLQALPQTLTYMMANPNSETPVFALIMTGEDYMFVKLNQQNRQYARSNKFTIANPQNNELYDVVRVMKRIMGLSVQP